MSRQRRWLTLCWMLCAALVPLSMTAAQTAEPTAQVDDASAYVLNALHHARTDSYHFTLQLQDVESITTADKKTQTDVTLTTASGEVTSSGDSHLVLVRSVGQSVEEARYGVHIEMEYIVVNRLVYLYLSHDLETKFGLTMLAPGWYRLDQLLRNYKDSRDALQYFANQHVPSALLHDAGFFRVIRELDREIVDGVDARVFDIQLDTLSDIMSQLPGTALDKLVSLFGKGIFLLPGTIDFRGRTWIDSQNGHLLRLNLDEHIMLPHVTAFRSTRGVYDQDSQVTIILTFNHYGEPAEIKAPTAAI